LSLPAETDLGAVFARGRSARFSILFSSTSSACSELLVTPPRRLLHRRLYSICWCPSLSSSSLSLFEAPSSLFLTVTCHSARLWSIHRAVTSFLPTRRRMRGRTSQAIVFNKFDIAIVEHYNFYC
ncbi:hypothetical protein HN51_039719, partial [Arachis hypogaea]